MKIKRLAVSAFLVAALQGCGAQSDMELVKNGIMQFNKTLTVGEAFDRWNDCEKRSWEEFNSDNGQRIVQFSCVTKNVAPFVNKLKTTQENDFDYDLLGDFFGLSSMTSVFQWSINKDETFQVDYVGRIWQWSDGKKYEMKDKPETLLSMVYNNETTFDISSLEDPASGEMSVYVMTDALIKLYHLAQ